MQTGKNFPLYSYCIPQLLKPATLPLNCNNLLYIIPATLSHLTKGDNAEVDSTVGRGKFFCCVGSDLFYVSGSSSKLLCMLVCIYTACECYKAFIVYVVDSYNNAYMAVAYMTVFDKVYIGVAWFIVVIQFRLIESTDIILYRKS